LLTFSPDGKLLASVIDLLPEHHNFARKIDIFDTATGKLLRSFDGAEGRPSTLDFTPNSDQLAIATRQNNFKLLNATTGKAVKEFTTPGHADLAVRLCRTGLTPDRKPKDTPLVPRLWNYASAEDARSGQVLDNPQCLALAPDDRTLAIGGNKGMIHVVDILTGKEICHFDSGDKAPVSGLMFDENGKKLFSQHWNGDSGSWDPQTGKPLVQRAGMGMQQTVAVSKNRTVAFSRPGGGAVTIWRGEKDKPREVQFKGGSRTLQFTPDGKKLLAGAWEGPVHVIDVDTAKVINTIGAADVSMFGLSPDGRTVATWGHTPSPKWVWEDSVTLWNLSGEKIGALPVKPSAYHGPVYTPDGSGVFVSQDSSGFGLWEMSSRKPRAYIRGLWPIVTSSKGRLAVCKGNDGSVYVWDLTGRMNGGVLDTNPLKAEELATLWNDLKDNPGKAYAAMWRLAGVPKQSVPFLEEKVRATPAPDMVVAVRVVEILEQCATTEARRFLHQLTEREFSQFFDAAQAALNRMK
jgi:WD40 repeat protein